jgi:thiol-disulfide isomerase/thioredoxin
LKKLTSTLLTAFVVLSCFAQNLTVPAKKMIGKPFPDFVISDSTTERSKSKLLGKVVFINFWFVHCVPCLLEMPHLNKLYDKYKADSNFVFISLTFENPGDIAKIRSIYDIDYDMFSISREECGRLHPALYYPANIIIDKMGIIQFYRTGSGHSDKKISKIFDGEIIPAIEKLLNGG